MLSAVWVFDFYYYLEFCDKENLSTPLSELKNEKDSLKDFPSSWKCQHGGHTRLLTIVWRPPGPLWASKGACLDIPHRNGGVQSQSFGYLPAQTLPHVFLLSFFCFNLCNGLNDVPLSNPRWVHLRSVNGNLFGKRVFADIIKVRLSRWCHCGLSKWSLNPMSSVFTRERQWEGGGDSLEVQGLGLTPPLQGAQVQFLVTELRSWMPCSMVKNKQTTDV